MAQLVSIIIINHNYAAYLPAAINSALAQDYPAVEVVVVDDGSTDGSRAIIADYGARVRAVLQDQGGHTRAANAGYAVCTGDCVLFLDADDVLYPDGVSSALAAMQPGDAKVQFQLDTIDAEGRDKAMPFPWFPDGFGPEEAERQARDTGWYPWTVSSGNLYARWFLEQLLPIDAAVIYRSPDGYLNKLAPLFGPVRSLRRVLGAYRVHGSNAWARGADGWSVGVAQRWLRFNVVLEQAFVACAAQRGVALRQPLLHPFQKLEYEMLAARFAGGEDLAGVRSTRLGVLAEGAHWLVELHPVGWLGSVARWGWLVLLAVAPRGLVQRLVGEARVQTDRNPLWQWALAWTRG